MENYIFGGRFANLPPKQKLIGLGTFLFFFFVGQFISYMLLSLTGKLGYGGSISGGTMTYVLISMGFVISMIGFYLSSNVLQIPFREWIFSPHQKFPNRKLIFTTLFLWIALMLFFILFGLFVLKEEISDTQTENTWIFALIVIPFCLIQTGVEEILFRGYFLKIFGTLTKNFLLSALISSLIFMLMHMGNTEVGVYGILEMGATYFLAGMFFCIVVKFTNSLEASWVIHFVNNFFGFVIISYQGTSIKTESFFTTTDNSIWLSNVSMALSVGFLYLVLKKMKIIKR